MRILCRFVNGVSLGLIYEKDQEVPHIALGDWADILVVAPLTANTLNKMTLGLG